jgi:mevalonate kinase
MLFKFDTSFSWGDLIALTVSLLGGITVATTFAWALRSDIMVQQARIDLVERAVVITDKNVTDYKAESAERFRAVRDENNTQLQQIDRKIDKLDAKMEKLVEREINRTGRRPSDP